MAELYATGVNRIFYKSVDFNTEKVVTAYIWNPSMVKSALQTFTEIELGLYYLDYNFANEGSYVGLFYENAVRLAFSSFRVTNMKTVTDKVDSLIENVGGNRFTEKALEEAPSSASVDLTPVLDIVETLASDVTLMLNIIKNKKYLVKVGSVWYLKIRNSTDTADIISKALKDKTGANITDIHAGIMAQELKSDV